MHPLTKKLSDFAWNYIGPQTHLRSESDKLIREWLEERAKELCTPEHNSLETQHMIREILELSEPEPKIIGRNWDNTTPMHEPKKPELPQYLQSVDKFNMQNKINEILEYLKARE